MRKPEIENSENGTIRIIDLRFEISPESSSTFAAICEALELVEEEAPKSAKRGQPPTPRLTPEEAESLTANVRRNLPRGIDIDELAKMVGRYTSETRNASTFYRVMQGKGSEASRRLLASILSKLWLVEIPFDALLQKNLNLDDWRHKSGPQA